MIVANNLGSPVMGTEKYAQNHIHTPDKIDIYDAKLKRVQLYEARVV